MSTKITVNSKTAGKYRREMLNNREHIVTEMVSIVGDSVMNKGLYPLEEVEASYSQINNLPAPNGHPIVNGEKVSAFHPLAMNAYNIGGFVRNPRMDGKAVVNEFWLDTEIADKSDDGKELVRRIEEGEEVGVSTGLTIDQEVSNEKGEYDWIARNLRFDHVAILLNEKAAGAHVGTKLQTNSEHVLIGFCDVHNSSGEPKGVQNVKQNAQAQEETALVKKFFSKIMEMMGSDSLAIKTNSITTDDLHRNLSTALAAKYASDENYVWTVAVMPTENKVVYEVCAKDSSSSKLFKHSYSVNEQTYAVELTDEPVEVVKKTEFVEIGAADAGADDVNSNKDEDMNKQETKPGVTADSAANTAVSVENAIAVLESKGLKVINAEQAKDFEFLSANRSKLELVINREEEELATIRQVIVANSKFTDDELKAMPRDTLLKLHSSFTPRDDFSLASGRAPVRTAVSNADDFEADYTTIGNKGA